MTTAWDSPTADPIGDVQRFMRAWEAAAPRRYPTKIEVTAPTLAALRAASSDDQRDSVVPGMAALAPFPVFVGVPILVVVDVEDGKARVTYDDGTVEAIP